MAGRIQGITIEIGGDTTKLSKALKDVDKNLKTTQTALKDVDKLLKFDPKNTELLTQKQKLLKSSIELTKDRLEKLREAQKQVQKGTPEWDALQREIIETEQKLEGLEKEYKDFGSVATQQIREAGKAMQEAGGKITEIGEKLAPVSAAAAALGGSLLKLGYDAVTNADDLNTLAKQTGLTTEEIQKMKYASDLIDVSFEDVAGALRKMKANMDGHEDTWKKLGVSVTDAGGNMRDVNDIFYDVVKALSKVENGTERDQLAMDIFGKSADSLAGIIDDGGASLEEFGNKAEEAGLILEQDTLDKLNKTNDTLDELKANLSATAGAIGADVAETLAPALEVLAGQIESVTAKLRDLTPEQTAVLLAITGAVAVLAPAIIVIGQLITAIGAIASALAPVIAALGALAAAFGGPILAIGAAVAAFAVFLKYHEQIEAKTNEVAAAIGAKWESIKASIANAVENIRATAIAKFNTLKEAITKPIEEAKQKVSDAINKIKSIVNNAHLSLPHFKLPHFRISGGVLPWGIGGQGVKPTISVDWYKKAYDNPVVFTSPTVLPTANGYKGFGDGSGAEIVMSLNRLRDMVGGSVTNNIVVNAAPGMNVRELAEAVAERIEFQTQQQRAVFA